MKELVQAVKQWGVDKGLNKVGHLAQAKYTLKETAELLDAYADQDIEKINDAIGDILVTLIVGASNDNLVYNDLLKMMLRDNEMYSSATWNYTTACAISDLLKSISGIFRKLERNDCVVFGADYYRTVDILSATLHTINYNFNQSLSLYDCLQLAYNEIKNRTGKLVNGQFIKD